MSIQERMADFQPTILQEDTYKYFIGDLCYVMHDEWSEVCDITLDPDNDEDEIFFELADGCEFILIGTAYGDGEYWDQFGNRYPVDSGTIGAIAADDLKPEELAEALERNLGAIHEFPRPIGDLSAENDHGVLRIGGVIIDTAGCMDEDDDDIEADYAYDEEAA